MTKNTCTTGIDRVTLSGRALPVSTMNSMVVTSFIHDYTDVSRFMEATDRVIQQFLENLSCNACIAGYKAIWHKREGDSSSSFFASLKSGLVGVASKLAGAVFPAGHKAYLDYYPQKEVVGIFKQVFYEYSILHD